MGMTDRAAITWLKSEGDHAIDGDEIAEVEKTTITVVAPATDRTARIMFAGTDRPRLHHPRGHRQVGTDKIRLSCSNRSRAAELGSRPSHTGRRVNL